jgi:hypothetical protein
MDSKTPRQWVYEFMPYARIQAAEDNRLDEMEGEEEDLEVEYHFGMELDKTDMPRMVGLSALPEAVYPSFMAEEEVIELGDDGKYASELREAISGCRARLADVRASAQYDDEMIMEHVESSTLWLTGHVSILHQCGDHLREGVGDVASFTACYLSPSLATGLSELFGQVEELRLSLDSQVQELSEDIDAVDSDIKHHIPVLH